MGKDALEKYAEYNLSCVPAAVINGVIKIEGTAPDEGTMNNALREGGCGSDKGGGLPLGAGLFGRRGGARLIEEVAQQYGDQMEVVYHQGRDARYEELKLSSAPAIIVGDLVRFIGLCPTKEGLIGALREAGLE